MTCLNELSMCLYGRGRDSHAHTSPSHRCPPPTALSLSGIHSPYTLLQGALPSRVVTIIQCQPCRRQRLHLRYSPWRSLLCRGAQMIPLLLLHLREPNERGDKFVLMYCRRKSNKEEERRPQGSELMSAQHCEPRNSGWDQGDKQARQKLLTSDLGHFILTTVGITKFYIRS